VAIDFSNLFMDEPSLGLAKYVSSSRAPEQRSGYNDPELDKLYDLQAHEGDMKKRIGYIRQFEKRVLESAFQVPLLWWHRIVATHKTLVGWEMSPSHNLGQNLERVWLNQ
jgi:peptide/nickel transport system substrate-binding protein